MTTASGPTPIKQDVQEIAGGQIPPDRAPLTPEYQSPRTKKFRTGEFTPTRHKLLVYTLLTLGSFAFLIPFYFVLNGSLKSEAEVASGDYVTPPRSIVEARFSNYPDALAPTKMNFWPA